MALFDVFLEEAGTAATPRATVVSEDALAAYLDVATTVGLSADALGHLHESRLHAAGSRKITGSYYTPPDLVEALLRRTLGRIIAERRVLGIESVAAIRVHDPACGSGNFLVKAATMIQQALVDLGMSELDARRIAFGSCVTGTDNDPIAVDICRFVLHRDSQALGDGSALIETIVVGDSLLMPRPTEAVDLVIGNPPFLSQLSSGTAATKEYRLALKRRFGDALGSYTDPAAIFMLSAVERVRVDGGIACLIQPVSFLASRDASAIRARLIEEAVLEELWLALERVFDAGVDVCAPVLVRGGREASTTVLTGREMTEFATADAPTPGQSWSTFLALTRSVPIPVLQSAGTLGDIAEATADFRDQFYGVSPHVVDEPAGGADLPRLATVGLIDPAHFMWGRRHTKIGGRQFETPRVVLADLDDKLQRWARSRLVPKLLLATQSRVLEVIVDEQGDLLPSVPVVTITTTPDRLWHVAACISSPPVAAWAFHEYLGTALSVDALKLSPTQVKTLPLPVDDDAWREGSDAFREASNATDSLERDAALSRMGTAMCRAYGVDPDGPIRQWWAGRMGVSGAT